MTPAIALAWMIWTRHRRGLTLFGVGLSLTVFCSALFTDAASGWPIAAVVLIGTQALAYLPVVFGFGLDARLEVCESGFPPRLYQLPMRTRALVGWPMLWGGSLICAMWL